METNTALFKKYIAQASDYEPFRLDVQRAEGIYIWDKSGKRYIDFISGICVNNLGHLHPDVVAGLQEQLKEYLHIMVYGEFIQEPQLALAETLCKHLPPSLQKIFYVNSGSEAMEGAVKLARLYNHRSQIVSFRSSYHGSTMGAMSALGNSEIKEVFAPLLPDTLLLEFNRMEDLEKITEQTSCVIIEPIQSGAGMLEAKPEFLEALRNKCNEKGALLIFDEMQSGYGRSGKLYAFEHYQVFPDILCTAKAFGGGMPLGAFISSPEIMKVLENDHPLLGHASTFGGHPMSCVSSLKVLELITAPGFLEEVLRKEQIIRDLLSDHESVKEVRGKGLFLAVEFKEASRVTAYIEELLKSGFITFWLLFNHQSLALTPPLNISDEQINQAMSVFLEAIDRVNKSYGNER